MTITIAEASSGGVVQDAIYILIYFAVWDLVVGYLSTNPGNSFPQNENKLKRCPLQRIYTKIARHKVLY